MKIIKAGGGVLYNKENSPPTILLIKRNGVWDLPKGKLEDGESIEECSAREVAEEVGVPLPAIHEFLCETYHEYEMNGEKIGKKTYWFSMEATQIKDLTPQKEEGITDLEWVEPFEALNRVGYQNLVDVIKTFVEK
ncbi:NUDIX hydrolase [Rhodohalobacter sp.]|uniref:NUDIX hydrolase n=1 Tax=Rhodohalobacter sp. TaxID=1974210 RepID=UPI002ACEFB09|nr:NUDIX domain-containing protein [Rhodohalobacter sp.]MDZ7755349.1 NUDIX domain-containing protein [Rhodohalobacter sp.]